MAPILHKIPFTLIMIPPQRAIVNSVWLYYTQYCWIELHHIVFKSISVGYKPDRIHPPGASYSYMWDPIKWNQSTTHLLAQSRCKAHLRLIDWTIRRIPSLSKLWTQVRMLISYFDIGSQILILQMNLHTYLYSKVPHFRNITAASLFAGRRSGSSTLSK